MKFFYGFWEIFKNTYFTEHLRTAARKKVKVNKIQRKS